MLIKCCPVRIYLVEQHAVALTFRLQNVKLQTSRLVFDRSVSICIDEVPELRTHTVFKVEFDHDHEKHKSDPAHADLHVCCFAAFS